jgi:glycine oxidase
LARGRTQCVEVTIRGGGIFGLSAAWALVRRGARVRLIEVAHLGAGSSGGMVGALSPHVPEVWNEKKAFQLIALLMAQGWWDEVATASGMATGYGRVGRLQAINDAAALGMAKTRVAGAVELWKGEAEWRVIPSTGALWEPGSATGLLVHDTLSARIDPRLALAALAKAIRRKGGEIVLGEAADEGAVLWANGLAGLEALTQATGRQVSGAVKGQAVLLRVAPHIGAVAALPQIAADGLHIVPHASGLVAIGSTSELLWAHADSTDSKLDTLIARATAALPALQSAEVIERWAALRPRAASRAPIAGHWPGRPGHFILNGGFKIGFGMAPLLAERMADLLLTGTADLPPSFSFEAALAKAGPLGA